MIRKFKTEVTILIVALIAIVALIVVYTQSKSKNLNNNSSQATIQLTSPTPTLADRENAIAAQFNAKNFTKIQESMQKPNVEVTIQSTECCTFVPPEQAANKLNYVEKGIPMDFNQNNQIIVDLKNKHSELKDAFIGISKNSTQLVAFFFNNEKAISKITMAASWKIFDFNEPQPLPH